MRLKVLVADDEPLARDGLKLLLGRQPHVESISEARNGREAIALIREQKPDLVVLDVQMPRTDGFAVVHAVGAERMQEMAAWLRPIVPEVTVEHVRAGVVYWVP